MSRKSIFEEIISERKRQDILYGNQENKTLSKWIAVLAEEVGSAAKQANKFEDRGNELNLQKYRLETIQVAAVAVAMLEYLEKKENPNDYVVYLEAGPEYKMGGKNEQDKERS